MVTLLATCRALVNSYLRLARRSDPSMFSFLLANGCSEIKYNPKLLKMTPARRGRVITHVQAILHELWVTYFLLGFRLAPLADKNENI